MYGRWIVLGVAVLMLVVEFIGFSAQVYEWIVVLFIAGLTGIEIGKFRQDRRMFRLSIVIPFVIAIVLASPINSSLSSAAMTVLRLLGIAAILVYFFFDYKVRNRY
ncbi:hypothetical protein [Alicyclobacillus sp. SO9]|uniref:hypothetical protein n=1 Tax=Alicyclobacillus sp. SO9 TaxID=2665646 RepID=UPI0018E8E383|nr:hypothetical protein [Alicyclobacillus sp. SO9]QQE79026.1 hypothetical protein GI364_00405 [Alicyclobacillus sp. SO9]